jgi:ATP-dependent helicase HepA
VILPFDEEGSIWLAWLQLLAKGFRIFDRSISDVQFIISDLEEQIAQESFEKGALGLIGLEDTVRNRLASERLRQDEQYALDRIALSDERVESFIQSLEETTNDEAAIERDFQGWLIDVMGLERRPVVPGSNDPFRLYWTERTRVPKEPWQVIFGADLEKPLSWRREIAAAVKDVSLLRQGTPLIDGCERYMRWDDRGTAFATWRVEPNWGNNEEISLAFRLYFIIEPGTPAQEAVLSALDVGGIRRRAQIYLPPWTQTVYVDAEGNRIVSEDLLRILRRPYSAGHGGQMDFNLGSRPEVLDSVLDHDTFSQMVWRVRSRAEELLCTDSTFEAHFTEAKLRANADFDRLLLRTSGQVSADPLLQHTLQSEVTFSKMVLSAVENPRMRLDAVGFIVIAGFRPSVNP